MAKKKTLNEKKEDLFNETDQSLQRLMDTGYVNVGRFTNNRRNKREVFYRLVETLQLMDMKFRATPYVDGSLGSPDSTGNKLNYVLALSIDGT